MSFANGRRDAVIGELLGENVKEAKLIAPRHWRLTLSSNGTAVAGTALVEEDWLVLDATPKTNGRIRAWDLLRHNHRLEGLSRYALLAGEKSPHLIAEMPLDEEIDLSSALMRCLEDFANAAVREANGQSRNIATAPAAPPAQLAELCIASGWPAEERENGIIAVELPESRGAFSACVSGGNGHGARVSATLASCGSLSARNRSALATLLLAACGSVRHARAAIDEDGDEPLACFELRLSGSPVASELDHALSALTVACDLCGPEARAFEDEVVARRYLRFRRPCH